MGFELLHMGEKILSSIWTTKEALLIYLIKLKGRKIEFDQ